MPVYIETLTQPSAQDLIDLTDLYNEQSDQLLQPYTSAAQLIEQGIAQQQLYVCRFNGRLLGAAIIKKNPVRWQLSHLCVRQLTWQRGVAKRLLEVTAKQTKEQDTELVFVVPKDEQIMRNYALRHQFEILENN